MSTTLIFRFKPPNGLALSRVAGCAGLGSVYLIRRRRTYQRKHQAEGNVGCCAGLGGSNTIILFYSIIFLS